MAIPSPQLSPRGRRDNSQGEVSASLWSFIFPHGGGETLRKKRTTVWAYLDGKKLVDVVQAALDNNMTVDDMKALLIRENPGRTVTFKVK